jgi:hypothetical protein
LSVAPQNQWREVSAGHASRSNNVLHEEASWVMVFESGLKTGGGAAADGTRGITVEVASRSS